MCYLCSPSGARKEEQREKAEEEGACCIESIPVNTLCSLIAVNKSRNYYSMSTNAYIYIHMSSHVRRYVAMLKT
jgi:hypothetical protein